MTSLQDAADASLLAELTYPRPLAEYHEDMGPVLWWKWEEIPAQTGVPGTEGRGRWAGEPPYVGSPLDLGKEVLLTTRCYTLQDGYSVEIEPEGKDIERRVMVGGWPGYHTHFTPLPPMPKVPA